MSQVSVKSRRSRGSRGSGRTKRKNLAGDSNPQKISRIEGGPSGATFLANLPTTSQICSLKANYMQPARLSSPPKITGQVGVGSGTPQEKNSLQRITEMINRRKAKHGADPNKRNPKGLTIHNYQWTRRADVIKSSGAMVSNDPDVLRTFNAGDLIKDPAINFPGASGIIQTKGLIQFVIVQRIDRAGSEWMLPSPQQFHDLVNTMESEIVSQNLDIISVLKWANLWNDTGLIGLSTHDIDKLDSFRDFVYAQKKGGMTYSLIPKELVANKTTITTLLKYNFRDYDLAALPGGIFRRNLDLDGSIVVTKSRLFGAGDKTLKGESKEGWRYIELEADAAFMSALERYPESHRFSLGSDSIQIWGGRRKPEQGQAGRGRASRVGIRNQGGTNPNLKQIPTTPLPPGQPLTVDLTGGGTAPGKGAKSGLGEPSSIRSQKVLNQSSAPGGATMASGQ